MRMLSVRATNAYACCWCCYACLCVSRTFHTCMRRAAILACAWFFHLTPSVSVCAATSPNARINAATSAHRNLKTPSRRTIMATTSSHRTHGNSIASSHAHRHGNIIVSSQQHRLIAPKPYIVASHADMATARQPTHPPLSSAFGSYKPLLVQVPMPPTRTLMLLRLTSAPHSSPLSTPCPCYL